MVFVTEFGDAELLLMVEVDKILEDALSEHSSRTGGAAAPFVLASLRSRIFDSMAESVLQDTLYQINARLDFVLNEDDPCVLHSLVSDSSNSRRMRFVLGADRSHGTHASMGNSAKHRAEAPPRQNSQKRFIAAAAGCMALCLVFLASLLVPASTNPNVPGEASHFVPIADGAAAIDDSGWMLYHSTEPIVSRSGYRTQFDCSASKSLTVHLRKGAVVNFHLVPDVLAQEGEAFQCADPLEREASPASTADRASKRDFFKRPRTCR